MSLQNEIPAYHRIVPRSQNRRCDADGQIFFGFPETVHAGAEAGEGDFRSGIHFSETRHDHLFINFSAVVAAVFGDLE